MWTRLYNNSQKSVSEIIYYNLLPENDQSYRTDQSEAYFYLNGPLFYNFSPLATSIALWVNAMFNAAATKVIWFDIYQDFLVVHQPCLYFLWCFLRIKSMQSIFVLYFHRYCSFFPPYL